MRAENFVNRASRFIHTVTEWSLKLRYQVCYARILDAKRKFLEAAVRYHDLSQSHTEVRCSLMYFSHSIYFARPMVIRIFLKEVDQEDLLELLSKAVSCGILAGAGPKRSRLLGALYKVNNSSLGAVTSFVYLSQ